MEIVSSSHFKKNNNRLLMKQEQIKTTLSRVFYENKIKWRYINNFNSKIINITKVILSKDASSAQIYFDLYEFSNSGEDIDRKDILKKLNKEKFTITRYLANNIMLRKVPNLIFKIDTEAAKIEHVENLLNNLKKNLLNE